MSKGWFAAGFIACAVSLGSMAFAANASYEYDALGDTRIDSNGNLRLPGRSGQAYRGGGPSRITTVKVSTLGARAGSATAGVSVATDSFRYGRGDISGSELMISLGVTAISFAHPVTAVASVTFGVGMFVSAPGPYESVTDHDY